MKRGFTLAEVLITLGIIGIAAAMTLPSLIKNHQKKVLHTQFLKAYSDLNNAALLFSAKEGLSVTEYSKTVNQNTYNSSPVLKKYLSYFKGSKNGNIYMSGDLDESTSTNKNYETVFGFTPKNLAGKFIKSANPCDESFASEEIGGRLYVMDNNLSLAYENLEYGPKICIDINGRKGPNTYGYDWFVFVFNGDKALKPYIGNSQVGYGPDLAEPSKYCNYTVSNPTYTCAYYALNDVSPEDPTKKYWTDFLK